METNSSVEIMKKEGGGGHLYSTLWGKLLNMCMLMIVFKLILKDDSMYGFSAVMKVNLGLYLYQIQLMAKLI